MLWYPKRAFSQDRFHQDQSSRTAATLKDPERMRLKLVFISSVVAATLGAGSSIAIILSVSSSLKPIRAPGLFVLVEEPLFANLAGGLAAAGGDRPPAEGGSPPYFFAGEGKKKKKNEDLFGERGSFTGVGGGKPRTSATTI